MLLLVSGASATLKKLRGHPNLGVLLTPDAGNSVLYARRSGMPWACDNAAFSGFNAERFELFLCNLMMWVRFRDGPMWVTAPDVVADAQSTLRLFDDWIDELDKREFPAALVAQDGLERVKSIPWERIKCLFIGGSTEWKLSVHARRLVEEAKYRGKWVHMGRVNTRGRMELAVDWEVDSVDGSSFSQFSMLRIPKALTWIEAAERRKYGITDGGELWHGS